MKFDPIYPRFVKHLPDGYTEYSLEPLMLPFAIYLCWLGEWRLVLIYLLLGTKLSMK